MKAVFFTFDQRGKITFQFEFGFLNFKIIFGEYNFRLKFSLLKVYGILIDNSWSFFCVIKCFVQKCPEI